MKNNQLEQYLRDTLSDLQLSNSERTALRELGETIDIEQARFMRNRAFDLVREQLNQAPSTMQPALKWLEQVVKTLDISVTPVAITTSATFSPGTSCRRSIINALTNARKSVEICVFTIADDQISNAIIAAHKRGIAIRIITDNDKSTDDGSDIDRLVHEGIEVIMDNSSYHMHHKFAIFDQERLLNGSFNWTRSASEYNQENLLSTNDPTLVSAYQQEFTKLWRQFSRK